MMLACMYFYPRSTLRQSLFVEPSKAEKPPQKRLDGLRVETIVHRKLRR
jgi:hypothetical protein